jgi:SRSO17 transposase
MGVNEDQVERFIRDSPWEYEILQDHLATSIPNSIRNPKAALILDDVGLIKQGRHSVGVKRQYSGALGKVGNCQVAVDLMYVAPGKHRNADQRTWPLGMQLYLPKEWVEDEVRRIETGVPDSVGFRTKPQIALDMIDKARACNIEHKVVIADSGFGNSTEFRDELRERKEPYILGITPKSIKVIDALISLLQPGSTEGKGRPREYTTYPEGTLVQSPAEIGKDVKEWTTIHWTEGTKGTLSGKFHRVLVRVTKGAVLQRRATDEVGWLLLEMEPKGLKAYLCWGLDNSSLEELVTLAHLRWTIEQFHKEAKQLLGLDRFEGRSWKGWHHHVSMVLLAFAFVSMLRAQRYDNHIPSIRRIVKIVIHEVATQELMEKHKLKRQQAKPIAATMLRGYSDW